MRSTKTMVPMILVLLALFAGPAATAAEVDWSKVAPTNIKVFYPGRASWEFLRGLDHGKGAVPVKALKKGCAECHVGENGAYDINADQIISGQLQMTKSKTPLEPEAIAGAKGFIDVAFQVAYDADTVYMRFQWPGSGASVADSTAKADRLSVQIADKIKTFRMMGCFITCHDDQEGMPDNSGAETHLYAYYTRTDGALQGRDKLDGYLSKGQFMDLWTASFEGSELKTHDEYVLEDRLEDNNDLTATGDFDNGTYTLVLARKLNTGDAKDIPLTAGEAFSIGISVHDNGHEGRKHYTSFPVSVGLSTTADIAAQKF